MLDKDILFILLIGVALGLGKVLPRLELRKAAGFASVAVVGGAVAIVAYTHAFEVPVTSVLVWTGACVMIGALSSQLILSGEGAPVSGRDDRL